MNTSAFKHRILAGVILVISTFGLTAQPSLLKDINNAPTSEFYRYFYTTIYNGQPYFSGDHPVHGEELFTLDPVTDSIVLVKDIFPGKEDSDPRGFIVFNDLLYFTAETEQFGREMWVTDGTSDGTYMVKDINEGYMRPSGVYYFVELNGLLYFLAFDQTSGHELWQSDGTEEGTVVCADIVPGAGSSDPFNLVKLNDHLIFRAFTPSSGNELWISDGTPEGTTMLKDIESGAASSNPYSLTIVKDQLYFIAQTTEHGRELWKSDGTLEGTVLVKNIAAGAVGARIGYLTALDTLLIFQGDDLSSGSANVELWISDGTADGTRMLKDIRPGGASYPQGFTTIDSLVYFYANDGTNGQELWRTNGTESGTFMIPLTPGAENTNPGDFLKVGNKVYFRATTTQYGTELWQTSGTPETTSLVKDINPGSASSGVLGLFEYNNRIYFNAILPNSSIRLLSMEKDHTGLSVVKYDGGTGPGIGLYDRLPGTAVKFFTGITPETGYELWKTDGTTEGTQLVKDINPGPENSQPGIFNPVIMNDRLYFHAYHPDNGFEIWVSDGTSEGTFLLKDIYPGAVDGYGGTGMKFTWNDHVVFFGNEPSFGREIYITDGTPEGTQLLKDINEGTSGTFILENSFASLDTIFLFTANTPAAGFELWKSDGTTEGTSILKDIRAGNAGSRPMHPTRFQDKIFFFAEDNQSRFDLWTTDGTQEGTLFFKDINDSGGSGGINKTVVMGDKLYYVARTDQDGEELYVTDGTHDGTVLVADLRPGSQSSGPRYLTAAGDRLFFTAYGETTGYELYVSDGTAEGTKMVKDILPGIGSSIEVPSFTYLGGMMYFVAYDGVNGNTLYVSDGTEEGTFPVEGAPKDVYRTTALGQSILMIAKTPEYGTELWIYQPELQQFIQFDELPDKTYGDPPFTLDGAASSELPVTYSSSDDAIASVNGNTLTITGAGTVDITAEQEGDDRFPAADPVTRMLTINKAMLDIGVADTSRAVGQENPEFRLTFSGFQYDDGADDLDELPVASSSAGAESPEGEYAILLAGGSDMNYDFNLTDGILTVEAATGIDPAALRYRIYPVPATDRIFIESDHVEPLQYTITDLNGKVRQKGTLTNGSVEVGTLDPGIYVMELDNEVRLRVVIR